MLSLLTALNAVFWTYIQSLKKDLLNEGFEVILLVASIAWIDLIILLALVVLGQFKLPADPRFYIFWLGVALLHTIEFAFLVIGLKKAFFLAANTFSNLNFVATAIYAALFLKEQITPIQIAAIVIGLVGCLLFFQWDFSLKNNRDKNKGLFLILFSLIFGPLGGICYKAATLHTGSYHQFLTGRLIMDAAYYSLFLLALFMFWYKANPWPRIVSFISSPKGLGYMVSSATNSLFDSWFIYKLPISLFIMLGTVSIPAGYVIGKIKYRESFEPRYIVGGLIIIVAIILFVVKNFYS